MEKQKAKRLGLGFRAQEIMKRFTDEFVPNPASFSQAELRKGKAGYSFLPQAMSRKRPCLSSAHQKHATSPNLSPLKASFFPGAPRFEEQLCWPQLCIE